MANRKSDPLRVRAVYGRPLVKRSVAEEKIEAAKDVALDQAGEASVEEIRHEIDRSSWKSSPEDLKDSFDWEKGESQIVIKSDHPAAHYLNKGVESYQMTHLTKTDRPIPIITDDGELIFREATEQSMRDGKWQHPGIKGKHFIDRGVRNAREKVKKEFREATKEKISEVWNG